MTTNDRSPPQRRHCRPDKRGTLGYSLCHGAAQAGRRGRADQVDANAPMTGLLPMRDIVDAIADLGRIARTLRAVEAEARRTGLRIDAEAIAEAGRNADRRAVWLREIIADDREWALRYG